jgi:hypothetical protein
MMGGAQNGRLFGLLDRHEILKAKGFSLSPTQAGGIVIDRSGHVHGIWDFDGESYSWVSPGSSAPQFSTNNPNSAVLYTLIALAQT